MKNNIYNDITAIETTTNTSYISTLLVGLYLSNSIISFKMLDCNPNDNKFILIQELIKNNFIEKIRTNNIIPSNIINEIRTTLLYYGYKKNNTIENIFKEQDITELYTYLINNFSISNIEVKKITNIEKKEDMDSKRNNMGSFDKNTDINLFSQKEFLPYININLNVQNPVNNIKDLLNNWCTNNNFIIETEINENNNIYTKKLSGKFTYIISNIPYIIGIKINRLYLENNQLKKNNLLIDIQKKIKVCELDNNEIKQSKRKWEIHCVICNDSENISEPNYYAIINLSTYNNNKWYIFDQNSIPCMSEINIKDQKIINNIQKNCEFILYRLDSNIIE